MEYDIFTARSFYDLRVMVRGAIGQGWQPLGGVAIRDDLLAQAMIRTIPSFTATTTVGDEPQISLVEINERMLAR